MSRDAWHIMLTLAGFGCEAVGLLLLVAEAARARRVEFGDGGVFRRMYDWFAFWLGPPSKTVHLSGASVSARGGMTAKATVIRGGETDLERVQRELASVTSRVDAHLEATAKRFDTVQAQIEGMSRELSDRIAGMVEQQRDVRRGALRGEIRGARLFVLGAALSAAANLV